MPKLPACQRETTTPKTPYGKVCTCWVSSPLHTLSWRRRGTPPSWRCSWWGWRLSRTPYCVTTALTNISQECPALTNISQECNAITNGCKRLKVEFLNSTSPFFVPIKKLITIRSTSAHFITILREFTVDRKMRCRRHTVAKSAGNFLHRKLMQQIKTC